MFKSVFAKYVTAVMTIFVIGFAILLFVASAIIGNYNYRSKMQELETSATALNHYFDSYTKSETQQEFEKDILHALQNDQTPLSVFLSVFATANEDLAFAVANSQGKLLVAAGADVDGRSSPDGFSLSEETCREVREGTEYFRDMEFPFLRRSAPTYIKAFFNAKGICCGYIVVCATRLSGNLMMEDMEQTIFSTAILVLVAAMIAVYFISTHVISPLREMSIAVDRFAKGQFDTRVSVRGRDEVARLAVAFNNMADSLENLEKMRSSFVANVSHDLRTPMTTISGFIEEIRAGVIPPEKQDYYLGLIENEVKRLSRLVASLLDLSRIQAGERKFVMRPFDICEMGRQILISFEQPIEEKGLQVEFECKDEHLTVNADYDAIYQVFYNLCHNAVKFSKDGGVLRIRISEIKDHKIQVSVYNEGKGIAKEDLPFVFERFYKSDKSRGLDKSGLGLGLYISKTIMDAHGETIRVNSQQNAFCEFVFTLKKAALETERRRSANE